MASRFKCEFALWLLLQASGDNKAVEISEALNPPLIRKLLHKRIFDAFDGGFILKCSDGASRTTTLALRALIHGAYSRDSLIESAAAHAKMLLFMLKNRLG